MPVKSLYPDPPPPQDLNIHELLFHRPDQKAWPDFTLYIDGVTGYKRTYREFLEWVYDGATALSTPVSNGGLGLRPEDGEMVGILSENSMDYIALMNSLLAITVPYVMLSSYSTPFELTHSFRLPKITRLFVNPNLLSLALRVAKDVGFPEHNIYILGRSVQGRTSYEQLVGLVRKSLIPRMTFRPAKKDTLAYIVFSSGTSGLPKGVMISHGNLVYAMQQAFVVAQQVLSVAEPPVLNTAEGIPVSLAFLPFHHTYGLHAYCFRHFMAPGTAVIQPKWDIDLCLATIPRYRVTHVGLVPSVIHQLVNHPKTKEANLSSLVGVSSGAAYLPPQLHDDFSRMAPKNMMLMEGYGMSECTIGAITTPFQGILGGKIPDVKGSTGILLPGMEARIIRQDGSEAEPNEPGELYLRGANIALGYWNNEKANKETFVDGWLRTGDRFRVDKNGIFFFEDRDKDTLKISGMQVSPVEIENVLLSEPDKLITDVTVAGVQGGRTSDELVPRAWVVLSDIGKKRGQQKVANALDAWIRKNLSKYKWLRGGVQVVPEIPKSPTGKVLRRVLQEKYREAERQIQGKL